MPMFYTPKPRQFKYKPRFYDPEKEKWEALKQKYADEREKEELEKGIAESGDGNADLEYFQRRVRELDRSESHKLTWKDAFRKREMPKFNYQPRFSAGASMQKEDSTTATNQEQQQSADAVVEKYRQPQHRIKIKRRFDISDTDYMKPISGTKIILYCFIVFLLLMLIFAT